MKINVNLQVLAMASDEPKWRIDVDENGVLHLIDDKQCGYWLGRIPEFDNRTYSYIKREAASKNICI